MANEWAMKHITEFIEASCAENKYRRFILYYRGHGQNHGGSSKFPSLGVVPNDCSFTLAYVQH